MRRTGPANLWVVVISSTVLFLFTGCSTSAPSLMDPKGPAARAIADLGWVFFILGGIIFVLVMAYLVYALWVRKPEVGNPRTGAWIVITAGMIIPAVILLVLFVMNTNVLGKVTTQDEANAAAVIEVVGNQWWWEVNYQDPQFETANEIHIPVGEPVLLKLTSEDVIHSFWVPELHGKMDLIPGRVNEFWIEADQAGEYQGECAEFCGLQHAKMQFVVIAEEQEQYDEWLARMQQPANLPSDGSALQGMEIFLSTTCIQCHTVRGSEATGDLGPDLTHLASRRKLGAGILPFSRANLGGWVANPHGVKPGVLMPPAELNGADFQVLLDFLMALE